jgi:protein associated with RNAse G/E
LTSFAPYTIKSFKYNGHLHRTWLKNGRASIDLLLPQHLRESFIVTVNERTKIIEADGKTWESRTPGISFFIPDQWYNIIALLEDTGIRYYCNLASPPYLQGNILTYIDYDLDVIRLPNGQVSVVDQEEYERHKIQYQYPSIVEQKVQEALDHLLQRIAKHQTPFQDQEVYYYYEQWVKGGTDGTVPSI